jgi:uncharacterized membrane protein YuzA (DUF378 family)
MSTSNPLLTIGNYIFQYAYPLAFLGAVTGATAQFVGLDLSTIMNPTFAKVLFVLIGVSGVISLGLWFNTEVPFIENVIYTKKAIRTNANNPMA